MMTPNKGNQIDPNQTGASSAPSGRQKRQVGVPNPEANFSISPGKRN
jgi:hypothetical protein